MAELFLMGIGGMVVFGVTVFGLYFVFAIWIESLRRNASGGFINGNGELRWNDDRTLELKRCFHVSLPTMAIMFVRFRVKDETSVKCEGESVDART